MGSHRDEDAPIPNAQRDERAHASDAECDLGPDDVCRACGVYHGDPCPGCGARGFHDGPGGWVPEPEGGYRYVRGVCSPSHGTVRIYSPPVADVTGALARWYAFRVGREAERVAAGDYPAPAADTVTLPRRARGAPYDGDPDAPAPCLVCGEPGCGEGCT